MAAQKGPTLGNGKICYIEIPTDNLDNSVAFYKNVFNWESRKRGDGSTAFDDTVGEVSGAFVMGRRPATEVGLLVYIWVDDIEASILSVVKYGGKIIQPVGVDDPELTARFADPAGNIFGLYQEPVQNK